MLPGDVTLVCEGVFLGLAIFRRIEGSDLPREISR